MTSQGFNIHSGDQAFPVDFSKTMLIFWSRFKLSSECFREHNNLVIVTYEVVKYINEEWLSFIFVLIFDYMTNAKL